MNQEQHIICKISTVVTITSPNLNVPKRVETRKNPNGFNEMRHFIWWPIASTSRGKLKIVGKPVNTLKI